MEGVESEDSTAVRESTSGVFHPRSVTHRQKWTPEGGQDLRLRRLKNSTQGSSNEGMLKLVGKRKTVPQASFDVDERR